MGTFENNRNWWEVLPLGVGVAREGKHKNGQRKPRGWHNKLRRRRKLQRMARKAQRGK